MESQKNSAKEKSVCRKGAQRNPIEFERRQKKRKKLNKRNLKKISFNDKKQKLNFKFFK